MNMTLPVQRTRSQLITVPILVLRRTSGNSSVRYTSSKRLAGVRQRLYIHVYIATYSYDCAKRMHRMQVRVAPAFSAPPATTKQKQRFFFPFDAFDSLPLDMLGTIVHR